MSERQYGSERPRLFTTRNIWSEEQLAVYQEIADEFQVGVSVIARAGEQYTHVGQDPQTRRKVRVTRIVPEGKAYVQFSAYPEGGKSLKPFYEKARAVMAQRVEGMTK